MLAFRTEVCGALVGIGGLPSTSQQSWTSEGACEASSIRVHKHALWQNLWPVEPGTTPGSSDAWVKIFDCVDSVSHPGGELLLTLTAAQLQVPYAARAFAADGREKLNLLTSVSAARP
eukprot:Gregarina_sp_Poly_1__8523@NODE_502_length_7877_cov_467_844558_g402_i0_p6_GENE_NODE_502_length_7877_cov_467_844558_g402_i0NODE_502_length_7877_cov_467_844558_g402_i0_p6_ORF_typecomplete_len118_score8_94_NODE_502_length_7877_cov_467_844558_g402_i073457698